MMVHTIKNCNPDTPMPAGTAHEDGVEWFHHLPSPYGIDKKEDGTKYTSCPWCNTEIVFTTKKAVDVFNPEYRKRVRERLAEMRRKGWVPYNFDKRGA